MILSFKNLYLNYIRQYVSVIIWALLLILYSYHFYLICKYSVDAPYRDEWAYFSVDNLIALPDSFNFEWLFRHNGAEHRIVFTHLMAWFNYKLLGFNFAYQKIVNFVIFGILLVSIVKLKNKIVGKNNFIWFPIFLVFLLSPIASENHSWAYESQIHFALIFSTISLCYCFDNDSSTKFMWFIMFTIFAMYSFASGVVYAIVCIIFRTIYFLRYMSNSDNRQKYINYTIVSTLIVIGSIVFWFIGYIVPQWVPERSFPNKLVFWDFFLNLIGFGFGFTEYNIVPGIVGILVGIVPLIILFLNKETRWSAPTWIISVAIISILAEVASISIGRAPLGTSKTSRYVEFAFMLIPFAALAWWLALRSIALKGLFISILWMICSIGYYDNWSWRIYSSLCDMDVNGLWCVGDYYKGFSDGVCQDGFTAPKILDRAKQLNISFTRRAINDNFQCQ